MKKLILVTLCLFCYLSASSQDYFQEATACFEKGDYECAKRSYTLFQMLDGKDMSEQIKLADECLRIRTVADGYFEDGEYEKARDRYQSVLEKNPNDPVALKQRYECLQKIAEEQQKMEESQQQLEQQEAQNPPVTKPITSGNPVVNEMIQNMVYVEGGTFLMGSKEKGVRKNEKPVHRVTVSDFMIGKYEVTQREWRAVMEDNPSKFIGDDQPVEHVSWSDIQEFLAKLNKLSGSAYRLPTEAEWEFAARGGNNSRGYKYAGSDNIDDVAWYKGNSKPKTYPVGLKKANELGLYDMSGNVYEWCSDWYGGYGLGAVTNPQGPLTGAARVLRGGSWRWNAANCRSTYRTNYYPGNLYYSIGFRIACSVE